MRTEIIKNYLKDHSKHMLLIAVIGVGTAILFWIYNIPWDLFCYMAVLWCVLIGSYMVQEIIKYGKTYRMLQESLEAENSFLVQFDGINSAIENSYQQLVKRLIADKRLMISQRDDQYSDMMEYYTLWVHQIKTPIAAMRLLLQSGEDMKDNRNRKDMQVELFKIEQYVEMVLQYLRMGNMSADMELMNYSLEKMVHQSLRKYAKLFIQSGITVDIKVQDCYIITDEKWLQFVIEQLLSNALKYTKQGKIKIYTEGDSILCIEDTGIGIRAEDLPRIFEKGFTGFNGRMDKCSTGIGLYLCKQVLEKLSHTIEVTSVLGKGTKIRLDLSSYPLQPE